MHCDQSLNPICQQIQQQSMIQTTVSQKNNIAQNVTPNIVQSLMNNQQQTILNNKAQILLNNQLSNQFKINNFEGDISQLDQVLISANTTFPEPAKVVPFFNSGNITVGQPNSSNSNKVLPDHADRMVPITIGNTINPNYLYQLQYSMGSLLNNSQQIVR